MIKILSNPIVEFVFVVTNCLAVIVVCGYMLLKSSGFFYYNDENKQKEYEDWIKREGLFRKILSIIGLSFTMYGLIEYLMA